MTDLQGSQPVGDDELIYRRIPASQGWVDANGVISDKAYKPIVRDTTGLSVIRAQFSSMEEAAKGSSKKGYYLAVLRVGDLRARGIDVTPSPCPGSSGHAEIPSLTYENRNENRSREWMMLLSSTLTLRVEGPFNVADE